MHGVVVVWCVYIPLIPIISPLGYLWDGVGRMIVEALARRCAATPARVLRPDEVRIHTPTPRNGYRLMLCIVPRRRGIPDGVAGNGLLDHPHYTRPENFQGVDVPSVLLSGDHQAIENWRLQQRLGRTWLKRPDLLANKNLSDSELSLLEEFKSAYRAK